MICGFIMMSEKGCWIRSMSNKMLYILNIEEVPAEINVHRKIFGNDPIEVDYDSISTYLFCNSRIVHFKNRPTIQLPATTLLPLMIKENVD
jgi:hypothetical protein